MSLAGQQFYREVFLRSEKWQTVRLEVLARDDAQCRVCGHRNVSNDAHHIYYPESIWESRAEHLVTLCRQCHSFVHVFLPKSPATLDEGLGNFELLRQELLKWAKVVNRRLTKDESTCWICKRPGTDYNYEKVAALELPEILFEHPICDQCIATIEAVPNRGNGWKVIRAMLAERKKQKGVDTASPQ